MRIRRSTAVLLRVIVAAAVLLPPAARAANIPIVWLTMSPPSLTQSVPNGAVYTVGGIGNVTVTHSVLGHWTQARMEQPNFINGSVVFGPDTYTWSNYEYWGTYFTAGLLGPETGTITYTFPSTLPAGCVFVGPIGLGATTSFGGGTSTSTVNQNGTFLGQFVGNPAFAAPQFTPGVGTFSVQNSQTGAGGIDPHWNSNLAVIRIDDPVSSLTVTQSQLRGDGIGVNVGFACGATLPPDPIDHFMLYKNKKKTDWFGPVLLTDQFRQAHYNVRDPIQLGLPADKNAEGTLDAATHLLAYRLSKGAGPEPVGDIPANVIIDNQCDQDLVVRVGKPRVLLVPTSKSLLSSPPAPDEAAHNLDHYLCYDAKLANGSFPKGMQVEVADQFHGTPRRLDLTKLTKICNPVVKSVDFSYPPTYLSGPSKGLPKTITPSTIQNSHAHLVCYQAKPAKRFVAQIGCGCDPMVDPSCKGTPVATPENESVIAGIFVNNQFGPTTVDAEPKPLELCIPSKKTVP